MHVDEPIRRGRSRRNCAFPILERRRGWNIPGRTDGLVGGVAKRGSRS